MNESFSTQSIRYNRNMVIVMVISPLLVMFLLIATFYLGLNNNRQVGAANNLVFDGSKSGNWKGKQLGNGCGSTLKDVSSVPPGKTGTSIEVLQADGCRWSGDGTNSRERTELVMPVDTLSFQEGTVWYIDFWQRFDQLPNTMNSDWDIWMQTHYVGGGQPNLIFASDQGKKIEFKTSQGCGHTSQWSGPNIEVGKWYHFTVGVKFSAQTNNGWIELYFNDSNVLPRKNVAILNGSNVQCASGQNSFDGTRGYLKKGVYRNGSFSGNEKYTLYGLNIYSSYPSGSSQTPPMPLPNPVPSPTPAPNPTPTPQPSSPPPTPSSPPTPPPIEVPGAGTTDPIDIPDELPVNDDGTIIADFNGDGLNEVVKDTNNDGQIDPNTEIVIDCTTNQGLTDTSQSPITPYEYNSLLNNSGNLDQTTDTDTVTLKPGPLPEVRIAKPVAYTFLIAQGIALTGIGTYLALTKLAIFAGMRGRLGL